MPAPNAPRRPVPQSGSVPEFVTEHGAPLSVVVGGMHGIGRNIARTLGGRGHRVLVLDKNLRVSAGDDDWFHDAAQVDLNDAEDVERAAHALRDSVERIHNVVFSTRYRGEPADNWQAELRIGLTAPRQLVDALRPMLGPGAIVFIGSLAARFVVDNCSAAYHVQKAGLEALTRCLAVSLGSQGVRVNAVAPGYIVKDESREFFQAQRAKREAVVGLHPIGRVGTADDVANLVGFLCSDAASFLTGQVIDLDGGLSLRWVTDAIEVLLDRHGKD